MQMPGQMRPDMPNIPQIKPSGMGQAAALPSEVEQLKRLPRAQLMQALMSPGERPPKWALVTALDQQAKENQMRQAQAGAAAQQQVAGLGTVAQEVATRRLARGGVVGFQSGGETSWERAQRELVGDYSTPDPEAGAFWRALGRAFTYSSDVEAQREREEEDRQAQQERGRSEAAGGAARGAARREGAAKPTPPTAPASAAPANRRGLGTGTGKPQRTPPPADTTPPPQTDGFDIKALQDAMRAAGTVSPAVQAARDALEKQRQASLSARERRRAGIEAELSEKPSMGLAALRIAQAAGKAKNLPEFFSLGSGAVADLQDAETKRLRELRRELMPMEDAEDRLREALAEKALADRSGDDAARKQADVEVLKAQRDYLDKQRTFRIQEQEAQARTVAAERSGSSGGESRGLSAQVTGLNNLIKAADDTMNNMMLKQEVRDAAARDKARHIRSLEALLSGNSSLSGMSTADLLKMLGATGGAK